MISWALFFLPEKTAALKEGSKKRGKREEIRCGFDGEREDGLSPKGRWPSGLAQKPSKMPSRLGGSHPSTGTAIAAWAGDDGTPDQVEENGLRKADLEKIWERGKEALYQGVRLKRDNGTRFS